MNINFDVSEAQAHYLKQYAAVQFPGSIANLGANRPIHLLQQEKIVYAPIGMENASYKDEDELKFYYRDKSFDTISDVVLYYLGSDFLDNFPEKITDKNREMLIKDLNIAMSKEDFEDETKFYDYDSVFGTYVNGEYVGDYWSYLRVYSLEDEVEACEAKHESWRTRAVSFCGQELKPLQHNLNLERKRTRRRVIEASENLNEASDYEPIMSFIQSAGEALLKEDMKKVSIEPLFFITKEEFAESKKIYEEFIVARYAYIDRIHSGVVSGGQITVKKVPFNKLTSPEGEEQIFFKTVVELTDDCCENTLYFKYPFMLDADCRKLCENRDYILPPAYRLFFFTQYSERMSRREALQNE